MNADKNDLDFAENVEEAIDPHREPVEQPAWG
jgi:hypothetical protein